MLKDLFSGDCVYLPAVSPGRIPFLLALNSLQNDVARLAVG